jgi:hypothetical protein
MDSWLVAAALLSAALHAGWNAAVKAQPHPAAVMTAQMLVGAVMAIPVLLWTGLPAAVSLAMDRGLDALQPRHRRRPAAGL